jgi:hypothetical protein
MACAQWREYEGVPMELCVRAQMERAFQCDFSAVRIHAGSLGKKRTRYAEFLAVHLLTSQCWLADAIVSELYTPGEMIWMKEPARTSAEIAPLLADKMKSV